MTPATDRQKRAIRLLVRKYPDTVKPLLAEHGGSVENLDIKAASAIMDEIERKHPRGDKKQEQDKQEKGEEMDRHMEDDGGSDEDNDDEQKQEQKKKMQRSGFRPGSKQEYIANALRENDMDAEKTREALKGKIGRIPQLTFTQNLKGQRVALEMGTPEDDSSAQTQHGRALKTIFAVRRALMAGGEMGGGSGGKGEQKQEQKKEERRENKDEQKRKIAVEYLAWVRTVRKYCTDKAADGHPLDEIGLRPVEYGAKMLVANIPLAAIKHAITMHYPPEARRALGVRDYNVQEFHTEERKDGVHAALPYCLALISQRIPVALVGPKGTGKTTLAKQISEQLGLPFGMVSMTSGTSPSAFNGRPMVADDGTTALVMALSAAVNAADDAGEAEEFAKEALAIARDRRSKGDTVMSQFVKIYGDGGVFLFDEMDAADENLLLGVNAALANGFFANPATGEIIEQSDDFIAMAGMNTLGLGSGRDYNSRNRLDAATLDRWNAGRVQITLDPRIEESMFWSIINGDN